MSLISFALFLLRDLLHSGEFDQELSRMDFSLAGEHILSVLTANHVKYLWGMVEHICIPSPWGLKQEDSEFEASLGFIEKFGLNEVVGWLDSRGY